MANTAIKCCTKSNPHIIFRPQDLVVLLSLPLEQGAAPTYAALASELSLTASESHAGLDWTTVAQLARKGRARKPALYELLVLFDAMRGGSASERELSKLIMDNYGQALTRKTWINNFQAAIERFIGLPTALESLSYGK